MWNVLVVDLMVMMAYPVGDCRLQVKYISPNSAKTDEVRIDEPNTSGQYCRNTTNMGNEKQET